MIAAPCGCRVAEDLARDELAKPPDRRVHPRVILDTARKLGQPWGCRRLGFTPPQRCEDLPKPQQSALRACATLVGLELPPTCPRSLVYDPRMHEALAARDMIRDGLTTELRQRPAWVYEAACQIRRAEEDVNAYERRLLEEQQNK